MKTHKKRSKAVKNRPEAGASMVEFSLVCGVFFFLLLTFIDFVRILSVQVALTTGAQKGLQLAQRIPGAELDIRETTNTNTDERLQRFIRAREQILATAVRFPAATFVDPSNRPPSASQLLGFTHSLMTAAGRVNSPTPADAIFLRPGEQVTLADENKVISHPTICPPPAIGQRSSSCTSSANIEPRPRDISPTDKWTDLLQEHPLMVELCASVKLFLPGFREPIRTCRRALGYRIVPQTAGPGSGSFSPSTLVCNPACPDREERTPGEGCSCYCPPFSCESLFRRQEFPCKCVCDPSQLQNYCTSMSGSVQGRYQANLLTCGCDCAQICNPPFELNSGACSCFCSLNPASCTGATPHFNGNSCSCWCDTELKRASCGNGQYVDSDCNCAGAITPECNNDTRFYPDSPEYFTGSPPDRENQLDKCDQKCSDLGTGWFITPSSCTLEVNNLNNWRLRITQCCKCIGKGRLHQGTTGLCCPEVAENEVYIGSARFICCGLWNSSTKKCT